ncbi:NAD-dependent protein deacylase Sirt4-like [Stegodyphus dumicola]|uniref:NAD-dependent protein deacylase Sirt4-like n=1 Tax=Stegodyphus dumicola TaxID=202533 RepID=UPI0015B15068|nr:NAD-dependent protein deacylase Sirt4-like [Stegodyphus dumicola]XP_035205069.1 NAD-dependent protein deacylase Sirt4-like [Stegodyphus dumicola]
MKFRSLLHSKICCTRQNYCFSCVPEHEITKSEDIAILQNFVDKFSNFLVLTGAGISTESGLPDYRSKGVGLYDRSSTRPVQYKDFISSAQVRKRYWSRNFAAWSRFSSTQPNETHICLAKWEKVGLINWLVTQNVDRLHHKAGSERVTELHGTSYIVKCLNCRTSFSRFQFQEQLSELNPHFTIRATEMRPDADIEIDPSLAGKFNIPDCRNCGGILKPDVVFFGETVPKEKVFLVYDKVSESDAVLVLGSSLEVYSGYRFILAASEQKKCIGIVNIGPTRADHLASFKLNVRCGDILPKIQVPFSENTSL